MVRWAPADVLLVVEVSDETLDHDLGRTSAVYARSGYPRYWVVAREGVYDHSEPSDVGYSTRRLYHPGDRIPVPYLDGATLAVNDLIAPG